MKNRFLLAAALGSSLFLTDCKKNKEDAAANNSSAITYQLTTSSQTGEPDRMDVSATTRTEGVSVTWTSGYITCDEIRFLAKGHGDDKVQFKSKVLQHIDLLNAITTLGTIVVPFDTYKKIEFEIELVPSGAYAAFELSGIFMKDGIPIPVTIRFDTPVELAFQLVETGNININTGFTALNTLNLDLLLQGITQQMLNSAVMVNNMIMISSNANVTMFKIISDSMHAMLKVKFKKH